MERRGGRKSETAQRGRGSYFLFILRELSSLAIAWFVVYLLMLVHTISRRDVAYQQLLAWSGHPFVLALNIVSFAFVALHAVTWFNLAPQAMVVRLVAGMATERPI